MNPGITSHTVIKNEDRFVWFAIMSVINYVDHMLIYDTGSTDQTVAIIKTINHPKVNFKQYRISHPDQITKLRQQQLQATTTDWFLILDGDEVWWRQSIRTLRHHVLTAANSTWGIITPTINCIGDIYHYQDESAGHYHFGSHQGHLAVRAIRRNIPGLHIKDTYPLEGYYDRHDTLITDHADKLIYQPSGYLHLTNLSRTSSATDSAYAREKKFELGHQFTNDFYYPEVFYSPHRPHQVADPFVSMTSYEKLRSAVETPLKHIKRRLLKT